MPLFLLGKTSKKKKKDFRGIAPKGEGGVSDLWSIAPNPILYFFLSKFFFFFLGSKGFETHFLWYHYLSLMATTITPLLWAECVN